MENEESLVIEKCVIFVKAPDSASRISSAIVEGKNKVPITLPRLKCLDDEPGKYFPYAEKEVINLKKVEEKEKELNSKELTIREKESNRLHGLGVRIKDIAKQFRTSSDHVRKMIGDAKRKLGEESFHSEDSRRGKPLSARENMVYDLYKQGRSCSHISEHLQMKHRSVTSMIRRAEIKLGERSVKKAR